MKIRKRGDRETQAKTCRPAVGIGLLAAMIFFLAGLSFGDSVKSRNLWGFTTGGLFPAGAFNDNVSQNGFGLNIFFGKKPWKAPIFVGFELSFNFYGYAHRHEYLYNIPEVRVDVESFNEIYQALLFLRLQPERGSVRPYLEGLAGASYLFTETTVSGHDFPWDEISSDTNFHDLTVTAGVGVGLAIPLRHRRLLDSGLERKRTLLDIKVRYLAGGNAKYLKQGSIVIEGDQAVYLFDQSATSFFTVLVGLSF